MKTWTRLDVRDYYSLFHLKDNYRVAEINVRGGDWLAEKALSDMNLPEEGVLVLGVQRKDNSYIGAPTGRCRIHAGDVVIIYGKEDIVSNLDQRGSDFSGFRAHVEAVKKHQAEKTSQSEKEQ